MQYRVPLSQPVSFTLLDFSYEKKIPIDASQEDMGDKEVWDPEDEQQLAAPIHHQAVPSLELPHPVAEIVEVPTASGTTAEQELLLSPDSPPSSKVCKSLSVSVGVLNCIDNCQAMLTMNPYPYICYIYSTVGRSIANIYDPRRHIYQGAKRQGKYATAVVYRGYGLT